jgi:hypothetical protein
MVSVGVVLGVVAVIAVIVLLYKWPDIVGHIGHAHNEYFDNVPPAAPATQEPAVGKLPIEGMSPTSLIQVLAVPQIKSLEGFTNYNDGNGNADNNKNWNGGVGNGYGSGRANIAFSWSTGVGAGSAAGAGPLLTGTPAPVIANTVINKPRQVITPPHIVKKPAFSTKGKPVLKTGPIPIGDVEVGSYARENDTSTPSFSITSSLVDQHALNILKTNLASGGQYTVNVTSNLPNVTYSFPLTYINDMVNSKKSHTYAFTFVNTKFAKGGPKFMGASTLDFEVVQTAPLPKTAPNAPPQPPKPKTAPLPVVTNTSFTVAACKTLGYPSVDNKSRLFSQQECNKLTGNWSADGTCTYHNDQSWSKLCSTLNPPNPVATSNAMMALRTPMLSVADVGTGPYITELQTPYPAFIVNATVIDPNVVNTLKTNLASSANYKVNVVSDIPGTNYTFNLGQITDAINPVTGNTFAYTFMNSSVEKQRSPFGKAKKLSLSVIMMGGLPSTAPNAQLNTHHEPTPPNAISSTPPSTMETIIPKNVPVSSASKYQFSNQSSMMDGKALAEKVRSVEGILRCK